MINIKNKIESQQAKNYSKGILNFRTEEMQFYAFWFKFRPEIKKNIVNFNIFCGGDDYLRPMSYHAQFLSFQTFFRNFSRIGTFTAEYNDLFLKSSKYIYETLVESKKGSLHIEEKVFTNSYKVYDSRHKTLNYKILMNALPLNSVINKNNKLCPMCNEDQESMSHLFIECKNIRKRWEKINSEFAHMPLKRKEEMILRHRYLDASQTELYSKIKHDIWAKRCKEAFGTLK